MEHFVRKKKKMAPNWTNALHCQIDFVIDGGGGWGVISIL